MIDNFSALCSRISHSLQRGQVFAPPARCVAGLLLTAALILLPGCRTPAPRPAGTPGYGFDTNAAVSQTNVLQQGDVLEISFQYSTNFTTVQKISMDGSLNLQAIGQVKAAGKTPLQLQGDLLNAYGPLIKDDVITVKVVTAAASVYVSGSVIRPGKIALERPMTVMEAIMEAGGFDPTRALLSHVTVLRLEAGRQKVYRINVKRILSGDDDSPFYLKPFDIVHVPTKTLSF
jgi:polysaccharide biosynthesis/export protein